MLLAIDKIKVSNRIRKDFGNIQELADDIKENGLINPPVVTPEFELIAGERRLRACEFLGMNAIAVNVMTVRDYEHQLRLEISENENRKGFSFSERVEWARRLEQIERVKADDRMRNPTKNSSEGETAEIVAQESGFGSKDTYRKAKFISENADPETIQQLNEEQISINRAYQETKRKLEAAEKAAAEAQAEKERLDTENRKLRQANKELEKTRKPEVVEKIIEKEVIPQGIQEQLTSLQSENKELKNKESQLKIQLQSKEIDESDRLRKSRINKKALDEEFTYLLGEIKRFLERTSRYTLLADSFMRMSTNRVTEHQEALNQMEIWLNAMKRAMPCGGNPIDIEGVYVDVDAD